MGTRERYEPGTFSWADLGTDDPEAAKAFYAGLFGWRTEDVPMGEAGPYTMCMLGDGVVCAIYRREAGQGPPAWLSYVTVADADATVGVAELLAPSTPRTRSTSSTRGGWRWSRIRPAPISHCGNRARASAPHSSTCPAPCA